MGEDVKGWSKGRQAQALLGQNARAQIKLRMLEDLLKDEAVSLALQMEYWDPLHDRAQEVMRKLTSTQQALAQAATHIDALSARNRELQVAHNHADDFLEKLWIQLGIPAGSEAQTLERIQELGKKVKAVSATEGAAPEKTDPNPAHSTETERGSEAMAFVHNWLFITHNRYSKHEVWTCRQMMDAATMLIDYRASVARKEPPPAAANDARI